jgi:hypothetical protein
MHANNVRVSELVELRLVHDTIDFEHPRALTLRVKGQMLRWDFVSKGACMPLPSRKITLVKGSRER